MDRDAREKKKEWKLRQKELAQSAFPVSESELEDFFEFVEKRLSTSGCDHTDRYTWEWVDTSDCPKNALIEWVRDNGGYCDCELLANTYDHFMQNRRAT